MRRRPTGEKRKMLKKFFAKLQKTRVTAAPFDPSRLNDPVAIRTAWTPLKRGGSNYRSHRLVRATPYRLEFRAAPEALLLNLVFIFGGFAAAVLMLYSRLAGGALRPDVETIVPIVFSIVFGIVFAGSGLAMLYYSTIPVVFDKMRGICWKGRGGPPSSAGAFGRESLKTFTDLGNIHALQIISELCSSRNGSYYSYELNLILKDGQRINVTDHGKLDKLRADAMTLAQFLGKPLWDATV